MSRSTDDEEGVGASTRAVVLIRSDPEESHRPGEAIRIALGLAAGEHRVEVILTGKSPLLLTPELEDLVDGEMTEKFLTTLREYVDTFYVEAGNSTDLSESDYPTAILSGEEVAKKMAAARRFLIF
ncbi:MAG TPA: hypothetical protein VFG95_01610 [Nitrospiria bacterium]|nr:hypothetical protein [Nitrospiria bacterium]